MSNEWKSKRGAALIKWRWLYTGVAALNLTDVLFHVLRLHGINFNGTDFWRWLTVFNLVMFSVYAFLGWRGWHRQRADH